MHTYLCVMPGFCPENVTLKDLNDLCSTRLSGQIWHGGVMAISKNLILKIYIKYLSYSHF
jgi:hypothetical protein